MSKVRFMNKDYDVDEHGYPAPPDQWDEELAEGFDEHGADPIEVSRTRV